jgi:hypothetical protein
MNDYLIARKYASKIDQCKHAGTEFSLTLKDFIRLHQLKRCQYTGLPFSDTKTTMNRSLDRIDNSKGYTLENTIVCITCFNSLKSVWEDPNNDLTQSAATKGILKLNKLF